MTAIIDGTNGVTTPNVLTSSSGVALTLQSNGGTTALTIATNQAITVANTGNGITYSSSAGSGLRMYGAAGTNQWDVYGNGANIRFSDNTGGGIVVVDTAARIGSTIGVGGTTPSSSGAGVTFPATQSSSSNANTLDDYEEGTWTPSVGGTASYNGDNVGTYTKVGRLVTCNFDLQINLIGTGSTSSITNFPFTNTFSAPVAGSVSYYTNLGVAVNFISFYINNGVTSINFVANTANSVSVGLNGFAALGNSSRVIGTVTYPTST